MSDVIPPPSNVTAFDERRPVLYRPDGTALMRAAGFVPQGAQMAIQTSGTAPKLNIKPKTGKGSKATGKGRAKNC